MKDFTKKREDVRFQVDEDVFEAAPAIPAEVLTDFAVKFADVNSLPATKRVEALTDVLEMVLKPASFELIKSRMRDKEAPIDIDQLNDIIVWLLEQYGQRPTQPSSASSTGQLSPESGTNLTETTRVGVSTFNP
jgi:hypothetical protein